MSLNWQMPHDTSEQLLTYRHRYNGKVQEQMHPVLHHLIFFTMTICADFAHDPQKDDVKKRVAYINKVSPNLTTITWGEDAPKGEIWNGKKWVGFLEYFDPTPRFDSDGEINGYTVTIDDKWIDLYWGLATNCDGKSFKKWFSDFNERLLETV